MTLELVPWRGAQVPLLDQVAVSRSSLNDFFAWASQQGYQSYMGPPMPVTTYGNRPAEPISNSFEGFVSGMLYADGPVAAVEAYRLRVFGQAPLLYQEIVDGRAGDMVDDEALDRLREPWPGGSLSDLMKRSLIYGDFAGNGFVLDLEDELVLVRPDWVEIVLARREYRGGQVGFRQVGILYYEYGIGLGTGDGGVPFLPGEYAHFVPGLPDPLATYRGMAWLTPLVREVQADKQASVHKLAYFENAASPNVAVSLPKEISAEQFEKFVETMDAQHKGAANAYKTLYTGAGADVTLIGSNMQQMDFSGVQGKGETRVANAGGVPPTLLSFSEGMQGSSLNAGNYTAAKRNFVDTTMRDLWANWAGSLQQMDRFKPGNRNRRLWYDGRDIPFLSDDAKDTAEIQATQASAINTHVTAGWVPDSARDAVLKDDLSLLEASGYLSAQLLAPGQAGQPGQPGQAPAGPATDTAPAAGADATVAEQARAITALADAVTEIFRGRPHPGQRYRHNWVPIPGVGDVRGALASAVDTSEVEAATSAEAKRITGYGMDVDFADSDVQIAREHAEGVLRGLERYPKTSVSIRMGILPSYAYAQTRDLGGVHEIAFNIGAQHQGIDAYRADLKKESDAGFATTDSPMGVAIHEFGHAVADQRGTVPTATAAAEAYARKDSRWRSSRKTIAKQISGYAADSTGELLSEAFADVMVNGVGASDFSRHMAALLDAEHIPALVADDSPDPVAVGHDFNPGGL